ncbi:Exportin-5, partial [Stegodyphus mimosarum]
MAYDEIMTVLSEFCPFMLKRLSTRWENFRLRYGRSEEQFTEWQEILDDELQRILTREYISFLGDLLHSKHTSNNSVEDAMDEDSKEYSNVSMKTVSELGQKIMKSENVRTVVICTAFDAMHWLDTSTNIKSVLLCELIFKKLLEDNYVQQVQEANYLLQSILYGLQELGEHDANQGSMLSLAVSVYGNLRPKFPELRETLISSVACEPELVNALEDTFFNAVEQCKRPNHEKRKKEVFRNAISKIIGKNIGQHHKRNIVIKNLCPLPFIPKKKNSIDDIDDETL